jgi:NADH:ubiquinone oxidoreductase subunit F (NADH-binding)
MSKKGVFGKLLTADKSESCEYFTPCRNALAITSAIFANQQVVLMQMKNQVKLQHMQKTQDNNTFINMIFLVGSIDGTLKIYHNETNFTAAAAMINGHSGKSGTVFDDDDDESPNRR